MYLLSIFSNCVLMYMSLFKEMWTLTFIKNNYKWPFFNVKFLYKKLTNAGEDMWLRAQARNEKFKHDAQKQNGDGMLSKFVIYDAAICFNATLMCFMGGGMGALRPPAPPSPVSDEVYIFIYLPSLLSCEVCSVTSHFTSWKTVWSSSIKFATVRSWFCLYRKIVTNTTLLCH